MSLAHVPSSCLFHLHWDFPPLSNISLIHYANFTNTNIELVSHGPFSTVVYYFIYTFMVRSFFPRYCQYLLCGVSSFPRLLFIFLCFFILSFYIIQLLVKTHIINIIKKVHRKWPRLISSILFMSHLWSSFHPSMLRPVFLLHLSVRPFTKNIGREKKSHLNFFCISPKTALLCNLYFFPFSFHSRATIFWFASFIFI